MLQSTDRWLAITISVGALLIAGLHVARPQLSIDSVTLLLIGLAVLPWLAPIIKKITLPGGAGIELRDVQKKLDEVSNRVSAVERVVFSGAITTDQEQLLEKALEQFNRYLTDRGFTTPTPLPTVHVTAGDLGNSFDPDTREIVLGKSCASEHEFLFREYAHYVLLAALPSSALRSLPFHRLESGVALYLACSFTGRALFGSAEVAPIFGLTTSYVATLENELSLKDVPGNDAPRGSMVAGQVWGAVLWSLRGKIGQAKTDEIVETAWSAIETGATDADRAERFVREVLERVADQEGKDAQSAVRMDLERRGLTRPVPAAGVSK